MLVSELDDVAENARPVVTVLGREAQHDSLGT